ncbi:MAG: hypothetical protein LBG82_01040 [Clostridiales Family XIII bacterium]|jgi:hypothetical protein|nr:hypothetical protein [Clostridiales Family XIII bacterium]
MARFGTLKRNIRLNIRAWDTAAPTDGRSARATASKIIAVFLALSLAGSLVPLAMNIVFRIPDVYGFSLGRSSVADATGVDVKNDDVAEAISLYMRHKTDSFQVFGSVDGNDIPLFTENDGAAMSEIRSFLDNVLVIGLTSLALLAVLYVMLVRWGRPRELRGGSIGGALAFVAIVGLAAAGIIFKGPFMGVWEYVIGGSFEPYDRMVHIFSSSFLLLGWGVAAFLAFVVLLILLSITHMFTQKFTHDGKAMKY